jgi:Asp-tRNA(Asn)/Glu-tRNA(Gln) amidotransferase A subunit family amidase
VLLQSHTLDTVGVYGRSVADLALITDALSAQDAADPVSYPRVRESLQAAAARPAPRPPRLAFLRTPAWSKATPSARAALEGLAADLGNQCVEEQLPPPFDRIVELHQHVMGPEDLAYYGKYLEETPELLSEDLRERLEDARDITTRRGACAAPARPSATACGPTWACPA